MQISPLFSNLVLDSFSWWVKDQEGDRSFLQDYISDWLIHGDGVEVTGGDYSNYLLAVLIIIDGYTKKPTLLDYESDDGQRHERRVIGLIDLDRDRAGYLDRPVYQQAVFHHLKGRSE